jgi:iron(III) transport system substrate-binding protein
MKFLPTRAIFEGPACRSSYFQVVALAAATLLAGIGLPTASASAATLVLYNAQHEQTVNDLVSAFEKTTGVHVTVHSGDGPEVANQIIQEGKRSPADVFFTENSPEIAVLDVKGLLAKVDPKALAKIPPKYSAADGSWVGVLAREDVLAYNPSLISADKLPKSLLDLAGPAWKGKVAIAPSDNDFLPLVEAVAVTHGRSAALAWLKGLKQNAQIFDDDEGVVAAVDRGAVATGIINNYYWSRLRTEQGADKTHSMLYHFAHGDVGGLVNVSAAGVLKTSKDPKDAQRFLAFLVSKKAQSMLAKNNITFEYPLRPGITASPQLKPFDELQPPAVGVVQLGDDSDVLDLLHQASLL